MSAARVEDLPVEVGDLDPVAVDQPHLADPAGGERPGRPAAEPADAEHRDLRLAQPPLALRRRQAAGADVGEVAQLAIEAGQLGRLDEVVVGGVLDHVELLHLGDRVVDHLGAELGVQLLQRVLAVERRRAAAVRPRPGCSIRTSRLALGRRR